MDERPGQIGNDAQTTVGEHQQPERQDPAHPSAGDAGRDGRRRQHVLDPGRATCSTRRWTRTNKTLPEIYSMGLRNAFTIGNAKSNGEVWFADYGPDATLADATRGPAGHVSMIRATQPANYRLAVLLRPGLPVRGLGLRRRALARLLRLQQPGQQLAQQPDAAGEQLRQRGPAGHPGRDAAHDVVDLQRRLAHDAVLRPLRRRRDGRPDLQPTTPPTRRRRSSRRGSTTATSSSTGRRTGSRRSPSTPTARSRTASSSCRCTRS